ncbi:NAD(P)-dependent dehydrogenase, short-chain alcohol dehydrogenase family [Marinobacter daqiaonensis]|uniref:NAD(P)-dependent dehydrogenase, short-chain alcohol dehydrogenase family n=1 Tax=Marinobacter daqiaonensis TaxID=650891 RepID=A0A1I6H3H8_9GAMM|nr:SDR family NAD(P)-dependent oxidoreductase [Marinobacter daqiaonensis]SFR49026.1 NAD(P)-dependent dehydrogenase, short-chain alcohol dehydrogenase family [Marinobacter daqiaonensis]
MKPVAVIAGANSAIATAMIPALAEKYRVVAVTRPDRKLGVSAGDQVDGHLSCDYSEPALEELAESIRSEWEEIHLLVCAVGTLHGANLTPEKRLAELDRDQLDQYFQVNAITPALILKHLLPLVPRGEPAKAAFLSAKIGGIGDNRLGGWYGYRASKAALNMLLKTASVELSRSHRKLSLVALHPGTTDSPLSEPFTSNVPDDNLYSPETTADRLVSVISGLTPEDTGRFIHWDGSDLPW